MQAVGVGVASEMLDNYTYYQLPTYKWILYLLNIIYFWIKIAELNALYEWDDLNWILTNIKSNYYKQIYVN